MKLNINDLSKLQDLKRLLAENNVSPTAIGIIEKALKKGMGFSRPEDLAILNIPTLDLGVVVEVVDFGTTMVVVRNIKTVQYRFEPVGDERFFFGYQFIVTFVNRDGFAIEQSYPIETLRTLIVDYDLNDLLKDSVIGLHVNTAQGKRTTIRLRPDINTLTAEVIEVAIAALGNATIDVKVDELRHNANPDVTAAYPIKGKVISNRADTKMDGYQVVVFAATANVADGTVPDFLPVAFAKTETNGYFVTGPLQFENVHDIKRVTSAKALLLTKHGFHAELPIRLTVTGGNNDVPRTSMLPDTIILVISESVPVVETSESSKDCGCTDLNFHEKKVLEEYSFYTVVRTSEPSIVADVLEEEHEIDLQDIYGVPGSVPFSVFKKFHAIESKQIKSSNFQGVAPSPSPPSPSAATPSMSRSTVPLTPDIKPATFNHNLLNRLLAAHKVTTIIKGNAKPVFKGRTHLNQINHIDWDDEPTIYQAASIAHGHLLHFKQEWMPDGYSIGDLVYSLPLAPGQKKQIAVLDWERRESAANSQSLDYEETLNNSLVRDRDINEVVSGTLTENIRGNSKASTGGIGFGFGSSVMGIIPGLGSFGSLLGISGGTSESGSSGSQNSNRESTAKACKAFPTARSRPPVWCVRSGPQSCRRSAKASEFRPRLSRWQITTTATLSPFNTSRCYGTLRCVAGCQAYRSVCLYRCR
jgi:hypothetical protein